MDAMWERSTLTSLGPASGVLEVTELSDLVRRMEDLEKKTYDLDVEGTHHSRMALSQIREDVKSMRATSEAYANAQKADLIDQRQERRALRNIVLAALISGIVSILVAVAVAAIHG